jgi:hypothetical protein
MQEIKAINPITNSEKKNAPIATRAITDINAGFNTMDKAANADIIVPNIPTNKQVVFLHKHFDNALGAVTVPKNTPKTKKISAKTPNPNAIQVEISINGIKPNANSIPTIAPNTMLIITPKQLQALKPHFSLLQSIIFDTSYLFFE